MCHTISVVLVSAFFGLVAAAGAIIFANYIGEGFANQLMLLIIGIVLMGIGAAGLFVLMMICCRFTCCDRSTAIVD